MEDRRVGLDGAGLLRGDDGIEAEVVPRQGGGQEVVVGVGEDGEAVAGPQRLQHRVDLRKGGGGRQLLAQESGGGAGVAVEPELPEDALELDGPGLVVAAVERLVVVFGGGGEGGAQETTPKSTRVR